VYGKIFESIYDGTLAEDWRALITFQQMIILCDSDGVVDMTPTAISRRTGIPIEHIKAGIEILEAEDPHSRTADHNGKRILRIDPDRPWGWELVNHEKYRSMRSQEDRKEYMRNYMKERRAVEKNEENQESSKQEKLTKANSKQSLAPLANTYASVSVCRFIDFINVYPRKEKKSDAEKIWKRKKLDHLADLIIEDVKKRIESHVPWHDGYIPHPTSYLNGKRWEDDIQTTPSAKSSKQSPMQRMAEALRKDNERIKAISNT
jgi:hypothetical protein